MRHYGVNLVLYRLANEMSLLFTSLQKLPLDISRFQIQDNQ